VLIDAAFAARSHERAALFQVAAVILVLLFIGIHAAWDNATYLIFHKRRNPKPARR
jgi:hypothetical protein